MRNSEDTLTTLALLLAGCLAGCGGTSSASGTPDSGSKADGGSPVADGGSPSEDSGGGEDSSSEDAAVPIEGDAAPRNGACTPTSAQTGTIVNTSHGRLDGTLVYVLPLDGSHACNGDNSHVHLQIEVSGLVYDVAVDVGATGDLVGMYQSSIAMPDGAWAEGWHGDGALTYSTLGVTAAQLPTADPSAIALQIETLLESTTQISIFCTGYSQGNGCHDVHYDKGNGKDGAIVLDPAGPTPSMLFFRFQGDSF